MTAFKYEDTFPIRAMKTTTWVVYFKDPEEKTILVFHKEASIENVVSFIKTRYPYREFKVGTISAGQFKIKETVDSFGDGRMLNQDLCVIV